MGHYSQPFVMSENSKRAKVDKDGLTVPGTFPDKFKCTKCKKYFRPPIWIVCHNGHNVCDACKGSYGRSAYACTSKCKIMSKAIRNFALEDVYEDLHLPISCKNHWNECDFSGNLESVVAHEEDCPYRSVNCVVMNCFTVIKFNSIENHMAEKHTKMSNGKWQHFIKVGKDKNLTFAIRSWHSQGMRFFATILPGADSLWHLWVTAACGKNDATKLRAEIRLSSNLRPDCNDVFYRPVLHYDIPTSRSTEKLMEYTFCLTIHKKVVCQHADGAVNNTEIPFTINIFEKVFLAPDKADIDEKDESGQDEEDGEIGKKD